MREDLNPDHRLATRRRIAPAIALFFLSPRIAEFMLGNVAIDGLIALFVLAPMYGGGVLLVREFARRTGRGWPTMVGLGLAYAVWEEAAVTQLLFNPSYHGLELTGAIIPGLGVSATQTINILTLHTVWSVAASIALVEAFVPNWRTTPWLGRFGLAVTVVLFLLGSAFIAYSEYEESGFFASGSQLVGGVAAVAVLVAVAFTLPRDLPPSPTGVAPGAWLVLTVAFVATSLFMALLFELLPGWPGVAAWAALVTVSVWVVARWARRPGWGDWQRLALVAGAMLTYAWSTFPQQPLIGTPGAVDLFGNIVFGLLAVTLLAVAASRLRAAARQAQTAEPRGRDGGGAAPGSRA